MTDLARFDIMEPNFPTKLRVRANEHAPEGMLDVGDIKSEEQLRAYWQWCEEKFITHWKQRVLIRAREKYEST